MQGGLYLVLLALATAGWGVFYYKKDYHPQPVRTLMQLFLIGLFSMIPVFLYREIYQHFLPRLAEYRLFQPLFNSALAAGVTVFFANLVILAGLLFFLSGALSLVTSFFRHDILDNIRNALSDEPLGFTAVSVMLGTLVALERLFAPWGQAGLLYGTVGAVLFLTVIEEFVKHLVVRFVDDKKLRDVDDAITLSVMVGLAFAFIETLVYAYAARDASLIIYRALISLPVHVVASGIFGYYYGQAHFAKPLVQKEKPPLMLARVLHLNRVAVYREEKIVEGLFFATLFHAFCNLLFEASLAFVTVPVLMLGAWVLTRFYKRGRQIFAQASS